MSQDPDKTEADEVNDKKLEEVSGGKLSIGKPKDKYEQEADEVADQVISGQGTPDGSIQSPSD